MKTKVFSFRWKEGQIKRLFESFNFEDGMKKVISYIQTAQKEGFEISGFSTSLSIYSESKYNINLRSF